MPNIKNLKNFTSETASAAGKKGCVKSHAARRRNKTMRETLKALLKLPVEELEGMTQQEAGCAAMIKKFIGGDVGAATWVRDSIGEKPTDKTDFTNSDRSLASSQTAERRALAFMQRLDALRENRRKAQEAHDDGN